MVNEKSLPVLVFIMNQNNAFCTSLSARMGVQEFDFCEIFVLNNHILL